MNRRSFISTNAKMGLGLVAATNLHGSRALAQGQSEINISSEIGRNHGHALELNMAAVILLMREANEVGFAQIDITGRSRHQHTVDFNLEELNTLLLEGEIKTLSSLDAGHTHTVKVNLIV